MMFSFVSLFWHWTANQVGRRPRVSACQVMERLLDADDRGVRSRSARSNTNDVLGAKPILAQIPCRLNVMDAAAMVAAGIYQFACIVALGTPDDHDHTAFLGEFDGGVLPL